MSVRLFLAGGVFLFLFLAIYMPAYAHGVHGHDQEFITGASGAHPFPFMYLGAKHMVTGYDHCLLYTSPSPRDRTRSRMPSSA